MKILVGLGNPGVKYETTRHNVGFLAVDRLVDRWRASGPIKRWQGEVFQAVVQGEQVLIVKPRTFMNLSGQCIGPLFGFYQCKPEDLIVIHDDLALPPFELRLKTGGGTGGHNGLKSIDENLGKDQCGYYRVRIGIGHPSQLPSQAEAIARSSPADYVLQQFRDEELKVLGPLLDSVGDSIELILQGRIQLAMNQYHRAKPDDKQKLK